MEVLDVPSPASVRNLAAPAALSMIDTCLGLPLVIKHGIAKGGDLMANWAREQSLGLPLAEMASEILTALGNFYFIFICRMELNLPGSLWYF